MATAIEAVLIPLYGFYNTLFHPLLATSPYLALGFFSAALAALFSLIYWYLLDIERAEKIKDKLSDHQEKMKEARKEDNDEDTSEHMQKTMELNQRLMKLNLKPMVGTMVFVALIFPWLGATFAPAVPLEETNGDTFRGNLTYAGSKTPLIVNNATEEALVEIGEEQARIGETLNAYGIDWEVTGFGEHTGGFFSSPKGTVVYVSAEFIELPFSLPLAGDALNWLGFYIVIAMPLTFIFRKALGVT